MTSRRWYAACLVIAVTGVHLPFLSVGYTTDDFAHLTRHLALAEVLTQPDTFGFFRPIVQVTYWLELQAGAGAALIHRPLNLLLHLAVVLLCFDVAHDLLRQRWAAFAAALAFALAPKANTIAIMWISARSEILMSLFALAGVRASIRWIERGEQRMLAAACACYALAVFSKETAILLPALVLFIPRGTMRRRASLAGGLAVLGCALFIVRMSTGALTPALTSAASSAPWMSSLDNVWRYSARALVAPAAMVFAAVVATSPIKAMGIRGQLRGTLTAEGANGWRLFRFALVWLVVFVAPAVPIAARSELRVYIVGFGYCVVTGAVLQFLRARCATPVRVDAALALTTLMLGGYQMTRAHAAADDVKFSHALVIALAQEESLRTYRGIVALTPATPEVASQLHDAVGAYFGSVLRTSLGRSDIDGFIEGEPNATVIGDGPRLALICDNRGGRPVLR